MMDTMIERFDGVALIRPVSGFEWPVLTFRDFPTCCGAGKIGNLFIPDRLLGEAISPACYVHDEMWRLCPATNGGFHYSNAVFLTNILAITTSKSHNNISEALRQKIALSFYLGVSSIVGYAHFWRLKDEQKAAAEQA